jgi:ABC-type sugar transport system permease subunit
MLKAINGRRAPTATAPPRGCRRAGPKSGARSGLTPISSRSASYWPRRTCARRRRSWQWTPFCFLVFLAALQGIPDELVESARLDTNSEWDLWREVILPMLQPIIILVVLLRLAEAFKLFDIIATLTKGGPGIATQSYSYLAFTRGFKLNDFGYASAMAYLLLIVVMIVVTLFFRRLRRSYE